MKKAFKLFMWAILVSATLVGLLVSLIYMSELRVSKQCETIQIGASYDSVLLLGTYQILTSIFVAKESSELWISNRIVSTIYCEIEFNESKKVRHKELVYS